LIVVVSTTCSVPSAFQKLLRQCVRMITVWQNGRVLSLHEKVRLGQVVRRVTVIIVMPDHIEKKSDGVENRLQRTTKKHELRIPYLENRLGSIFSESSNLSIPFHSCYTEQAMPDEMRKPIIHITYQPGDNSSVSGLPCTAV
jgi:hypothetical protein